VADDQGHLGDTPAIAGILERDATDGGLIKLVTTRGEFYCLSRQPLSGRDAARESNVGRNRLLLEKNPSSAQISHRGEWLGARVFVEEGLVNRPFSESVSELETYGQHCSERLRHDFTAPASCFIRNFFARLQPAATSARLPAVLGEIIRDGETTKFR
jgi:hypothetical protein